MKKICVLIACLTTTVFAASDATIEHVLATISSYPMTDLINKGHVFERTRNAQILERAKAFIGDNKEFTFTKKKVVYGDDDNDKYNCIVSVSHSFPAAPWYTSYTVTFDCTSADVIALIHTFPNCKLDPISLLNLTGYLSVEGLFRL